MLRDGSLIGWVAPLSLLFTAACSPALPPAQSAPEAPAAAAPSPGASPSVFAPAATIDPAAAYQMPPADLVRLADAPPPPRPLVSPDGATVLFATVPSLVPIAEVAQPELKLAGLRFNPDNHAESRASYASALVLVDVASGKENAVTGLPAEGRLRQPEWSPDGQHLAFLVVTTSHVELWTVGRAGGDAHRLGARSINAIQPTRACHWLSDSRALVCRVVPADQPPAPSAVAIPTGPNVEESTGKKSPAPTFQDLLHDEHDAQLFEHYLTSEVWITSLDGQERQLGGPSLLWSVDPSPDATKLLVASVHRPFSYHVPEQRFPLRTEVWERKDGARALIADLPLASEVPIDTDAERTGRRQIGWRADLPASVFWVEAKDGGDPHVEAAVRDELYTLGAPFTAAPTRLLAMPFRFHDVFWSSGRLAIAHDRWFKTRHEDEWRLEPAAPSTAPQKIGDRSYEDRYGDPGELQTRSTPQGTSVLWTDAGGTRVIRFGDGASPEGDRPFVDEQDLTTLKATRRFRSQAPSYELPMELFPDGQHVLSRRESLTDNPNFHLRDLGSNAMRPLTHLANPYPELATAKHELIHYKRYDGLPLSGTLYTPPGYDGKTRLPVLMWAYPQEFKDTRSAGQVTDSPYRFARLTWASPLFWLERGFAVLTPSFPIVGVGKTQPNDTYVKQLVGDASAAIDELVRRGVGDRDRMAVGGHSYGAFMTANLLAHSRLFRAGIARSGAYNRTLTPFGFQNEERNFWEATSTYVDMSPFVHATTVDDPILLVHGMEDDNTGTYPIQSERFFAALAGLGKTARLVRLPHEAHAYRARESILDMLAEMDRWLDRYVKNAAPRAQGTGTTSVR